MSTSPGTPAAPPAPGSDVRLVLTKWVDRPHWEFPGRLLGSDEHGDWVGFAAGTTMTRPGATYVAPVPQVVLVPGPGPEQERGFLATFHAAGGPVHTYVDLTTPPVWDGPVLRAVDLDLDVVRGPTGRVWVDDEDEFARHRVELDYPPELVRLATAGCERLHAAVRDRTGPFAGAADVWLGRAAGLTPPS